MLFRRVISSIVCSAIAFVGIGEMLVEPAEAARRRIRFGAYVPEAPLFGMSGIHKLESQIGHKVGVTHFYQAWGGEAASYEQSWIEQAATDRRKVLLTWEPWDYRNPSAIQPEFSLATIVIGLHDPYIRSWAQGLAGYGGTVYLRPMHEMNGPWYPWGSPLNGSTPALYKAAWQRMHTIFAQEGADNVRWVWSPLVDDVPAENRFEQYYPGHEYVDVLGLDGYNWGTSEPGYGDWRSFRKVFSGAYARIAALGTQPIWLAEVGSAREGGNKVRWIRSMFRALVVANDFPRVRALVWFHANKERDWRATSPRTARRVFRRWLPRL